jgi:hypothetical protein
MDAARSGKTMQYERTPWIPGSIFYADASDDAPLCHRKNERRGEEKVPHCEIKKIDDEIRNGFLGDKLSKVLAVQKREMIKLAEFLSPKQFSYFFCKKYKE